MTRELTYTGGRYTNEQRFTSPGTWTCPPTVSWVEVTVVGGGGGSGAFAREYPYSPGEGTGAGGGGAVVIRTIPVSGPVPVTVGAGGAGGVSYTQPIPTPVSAPINICGSVGGTSAFGSLGPGPVPLIPATTIAAGGGGGGGQPLTPDVSRWGRPAPTIGGGAGGTPGSLTFYFARGGLGSPSAKFTGGGASHMEITALDDIRQNNGYLAVPSPTMSVLVTGVGIQGFGGGGGGGMVDARLSPYGTYDNYAVGVDGGGATALRRQSTPAGPYTISPLAIPGDGQANTGGGAGGLFASQPLSIPPTAPSDFVNGYSGGSGVVIVRWNQ